MHLRCRSARRAEQRAQVDPHARQVAHDRENSHGHSEKDALPTGDERPSQPSGICEVESVHAAR